MIPKRTGMSSEYASAIWAWMHDLGPDGLLAKSRALVVKVDAEIERLRSGTPAPWKTDRIKTLSIYADGHRLAIKMLEDDPELQ